MRAGRLRHRITIQEKTNTQDPTTGVVSASWSNAYTSVPAEVVPLSGREFLAAQQRQAEVTARITIRNGLTIDQNMRILHEGKTYDIAAILPDPTFSRHVTIMAAEGVNNG